MSFHELFNLILCGDVCVKTEPLKSANDSDKNATLGSSLASKLVLLEGTLVLVRMFMIV